MLIYHIYHILYAICTCIYIFCIQCSSAQHEGLRSTGLIISYNRDILKGSPARKDHSGYINFYLYGKDFKGLSALHKKLQKCSYLPYTLQLVFTTATIFQQFYMWATIFTIIFFKKILAVFCLVCKGLKLLIFINKIIGEILNNWQEIVY